MIKSFQYSIRSLLALTAGAAVMLVGLLWLTKDYRERWQSEERLRGMGAVYAHVGEDRESSVVFSQRITTKDLGQVKSIERVELQGFAIDDSTLANLCELEKIDSVMIQSCMLEDIESLSHFERIPELKWLLFWNTPITDQSVEVIAKLRQLEGVSFKNTKMTPAGLAKLRAAMPNVKIDSRP
jgi:hypothetical protein